MKLNHTLLGHRLLSPLPVEFDPGCEAMIFTVDGTPLQGFCRDIFPGHILTLASGITGGFGGDRRVEYIIPHKAREEGYHEFVIESSCNGMFGVPWNGDTIQPPDVYPPPTIHSKV